MKGNSGSVESARTVGSLYKSFSSCSEHHAPELLDLLHISTAVDEAIVIRARSKKVVLVTGNPGDGKTHLIRKVQKDLPRTVTVRQDANELDNKTLIEEIDVAISEQRALVLAINEGILLEICEEARRRYPWAASLLNAVLRPYNYGTGPEAELGQVVILDLNLRNNLAPQIVGQAIERIVALSEASGDLEATAAFNLSRLKEPGVSARICHLLDAVGATGFHATMRDLLGFVAFLIFGDETVDALTAQPYFLNAFEGGQGPLFDRIRQFDPLRTASPFLDDKLYMIEDELEDWVDTYPGELRERENILSFQSVKRRAFFEHKQGLSLLRPTQTDVEKVFRQLRQRSHSPEQTAVRLLNRFFDSREGLSDRLILWKAHQFDARPTRFVAVDSSWPPILWLLECLSCRVHFEKYSWITTLTTSFSATRTCLLERGSSSIGDYWRCCSPGTSTSGSELAVWRRN